MSIKLATEIPQDIIESIIDQSEHIHDLFNLCLVSRSFVHHSRRQLYRRIAISNKYSGYVPPHFPKLGLKKALKLFTVLAESNPPLARYIDALYLDAHVTEAELPIEDQTQLGRFICTSLRSMGNLKTLSITWTFCHPDIAFALDDAKFSFQLKNFHYLPGNRLYANKGEYLDKIIMFLHSQSLITRLHLHWYRATPFPAFRFLQLEELGGHTPLIEAALPGLPSVSRLVWSVSASTLVLTEQVIDKLPNLNDLTVRHSQSPNIVFSMISYLKNLQVLHLAGVTDTVNVFYKRDFTYIPDLPNLRIFIYSYRYDNITSPLEVHIPSHRRRLKRETKSLVEQWFTTSTSSLRYAYFQIWNYSHFPRSYLAWERDVVGEVKEVGAGEVWHISPWI